MPRMRADFAQGSDYAAHRCTPTTHPDLIRCDADSRAPPSSFVSRRGAVTSDKGLGKVVDYLLQWGELIEAGVKIHVEARAGHPE